MRNGYTSPFLRMLVLMVRAFGLKTVELPPRLLREIGENDRAAAGRTHFRLAPHADHRFLL